MFLISDPYNAALNKTVLQSSTANDKYAELAIDGVTDQVYYLIVYFSINIVIFLFWLSDLYNAALNKPVLQSSTVYSRYAELAVDGTTSQVKMQDGLVVKEFCF